MELRELLIKGHVPVLDPYSLNETSDEFFAKYGSFLERIALMAKKDTGYVLYSSASAPTDSKYSEFFSSFSQIASDIGVEVYAVVSTFIDEYFARDPKYGAFRSGVTRDPVGTFVCPVQKSYWNYLSAILDEIASMSPIKGVVLLDNLFARQEFCFCETCRKEFSELVGLEREFVFDTLLTDPEILERWYQWRADKIYTALSTIVDALKSKHPDVESLISVDLDPEMNYIEGGKKHFGQDVKKLSDIGDQLLINVLPLSATLPQPETPDYKQVISELYFTSELNRIGRKFSLFKYGITNDDIEILEKIKSEIDAKYLFISEEYPETYKERREIQLGLR